MLTQNLRLNKQRRALKSTDFVLFTFGGSVKDFSQNGLQALA